MNEGEIKLQGDRALKGKFGIKGTTIVLQTYFPKKGLLSVLEA